MVLALVRELVRARGQVTRPPSPRVPRIEGRRAGVKWGGLQRGGHSELVGVEMPEFAMQASAPKRHAMITEDRCKAAVTP